MTLAKKRAKYYTYIFTYKKRREALKLKYGIKGEHSEYKKISPTYLIVSAKYTRKMTTWAQNIKRIDALTAKLDNLIKNISDFFDKDIVNKNGQKVDAETKFAKSVYYKYGVEVLRIEPKTLRIYIGVTTNWQPFAYRSNLTNSFKTTPKNKELYFRFNEYVKINQL